MTTSSKKNRVVFIDLMRAFAVFMMVQGHTTDVVLADIYRDFNSPVYSFWNFMRGITAPIFLFTMGTTFSYLFKLNKHPFSSNPRVKKGIKRFFLLLGLGYLMRYPTFSVIYFNTVSPQEWQTFFVVDVLQLIAFGILAVLAVEYLSEKLKINDYILLSISAFIVFVLSPFFEKINWTNFLHPIIANYFYKGGGSFFPLFPWLCYVFCGAFLGNYLANNPMIFKTIRFSSQLAIAGLAFIAASLVGDFFEVLILGQSFLWTTSPNLVLFRLGLVLLLNAIVSVAALKIEKMPTIVILVGRNTLMIYVIHVVILYGSAWTPGFPKYLVRSLNLWQTVIMDALMITALGILVQLLHLLKIRNKSTVT
jgi:Predicted membrane protein